MRICNCCQGTQFEVNPIDEALCCIECGTIAEEAQLRADAGAHYESMRSLSLKESTATKEWLEKFAIYFDGTEETYNEALDWYKAYRRFCPKKYTKELALYIIYIIKKPLSPGISLDDMINKCPDSVDPRRIRHTHSLLSRVIPHIPVNWNVKIDMHFPDLFALISANIHQTHNDTNRKLKKKRIPPDALPDEEEVRSMTVKLVSIYIGCANGAGKHQRLTIASAMILSYVHFYQKRITAKSPRTPNLTLQQVLHAKKLAASIVCGYRTLLSYLNALQDFIFVCTKELTWIARNNPKLKSKDAYIFLDQVVDFLKPKGFTGSAFPLQQETVPSFLRAKAESDKLELALERAKIGHVDDFRPDTVEYNMRTLLDHGVGEEEIRNKSDIRIKQMCDAYYCRQLINSTTTHAMDDLNQPEITEHDMSEAELNAYLHSSS
ncbi:hypothetical protein K501DRAFT_330013 [Backusella circina FSU 941]|nr:hypothetical protein K501DRAFT_330013 [Backusella circina FSU 941]